MYYGNYKPAGNQFTLKVMINKQKTKVLFAAIDSDFADVLLSFLTLPLGTIARILKKHGRTIGCLTALYSGLENLGTGYFGTDVCKQMLLNPRSSFASECRKLKLDLGENQPTRYFACETRNCSSFIPRNIRYLMMFLVELYNRQSFFLISDDLKMVPNVAVPALQTLVKLGITDTDGAELRTVTFGFNEIMDLLMWSLISLTPLTDIILNKRKIESIKRELEQETLLHQLCKGTGSYYKSILKLKLMVQKSTNKLLFAQAENDFVDFLCSLLTVPLGGVQYLFGSNTNCLKSLENLYKSVDLIEDKYFAAPNMKKRLMKPDIAKGYMSKNQVLPLGEHMDQTIYYNQDLKLNKEWLSFSNTNGAKLFTIIGSFKGKGDFVKEATMYMVSDDLTVAPLCMTSSLSILNRLNISLTDVKEVEVHIVYMSGLSILKASLTSTSALTDGLKISPVLNKQPKQEN
ncbi:hypothetical protein MIMGU_mgv1a020132mg [Erythranthe guttata]|uniref:Uncharacterized protein n=1 Tax=Erythranthe guttata TaxID=4155 RepID=A0A022R5D4_ERYGU|nr:hypothetical protein MIMGU_mgv1a020132mg [Erythranthe guttata]